MYQTPDNKATGVSPIYRVRVWYGLLVFVFAVFVIRLFYLQVIRYDHYKKAALSDQLKEYEIAAPRGIIKAHQGNTVVPLVLNQKLYTLYADPTLIKQPSTVAASLAGVIGRQAGDITKQLKTPHTRYVVLARKLTAAQKDKILGYKYPGIGTQEQDYRTYPDGSLAAQVLGFVDGSGQGQYGIEQALNSQLAGKSGRLKAVTDINGVPLAASPDNISVQPTPGNNVTLTLNLGLQTQVEKILKQYQQQYHAQSVSALVLDANNGAVKAMANYPTYDPSNYQNVSDASLFQNRLVSYPIEMGSIMKTLTTAAALNEGVITKDTTFYDPAQWLIDGVWVHDVSIDGGPQQRSIGAVLDYSLNTGAIWMLMQMGGGQINAHARNIWYDYMTNHFRLGQPTGIAQGYEATGYVPKPQANGAGIDLTYAETAFGQALTATALQMGSAFSSAINGGTYYKPYLVDQTTNASGQTTKTQPKVLGKNVVSQKTSQDLQSLLEYVAQRHVIEGYPYMNFGPNYIVGGKTGSAQVALPSGGYSPTEVNGSYIGFVGGDKPQYVIVVYAIKPNIVPEYYAGAHVAQPIFADIAHMLINDYGVTPKSH